MMSFDQFMLIDAIYYCDDADLCKLANVLMLKKGVCYYAAHSFDDNTELADYMGEWHVSCKNGQVVMRPLPAPGLSQGRIYGPHRNFSIPSNGVLFADDKVMLIAIEDFRYAGHFSVGRILGIPYNSELISSVSPLDTVLVPAGILEQVAVPSVPYDEQQWASTVNVPEAAIDAFVGRLQMKAVNGVKKIHPTELPANEIAAQWSTLGREENWRGVSNWNTMTSAAIVRAMQRLYANQHNMEALVANTRWSEFCVRMRTVWRTTWAITAKVVSHPATIAVAGTVVGLLLQHRKPAEFLTPVVGRALGPICEEGLKHVLPNPIIAGLLSATADMIVSRLQQKAWPSLSTTFGFLFVQTTLAVLPFPVATIIHYAYNAWCHRQVNPRRVLLTCQGSACASALPSTQLGPTSSGLTILASNRAPVRPRFVQTLAQGSPTLQRAIAAVCTTSCLEWGLEWLEEWLSQNLVLLSNSCGSFVGFCRSPIGQKPPDFLTWRTILLANRRASGGV
jgi:hypothetical protein